VVKDLIEELRQEREALQEERKEVHQLKELASDMVREADRLSQRISTHLKAMVEVVKDLQNITHV
jgi:uncharacterized coiled-coil DUF342 family protein